MFSTMRYMLLSGTLRVLSWLPLWLLHALGRGLGTLLYVLPTRARQTTVKNLETCFPDRSADQIAALARESLQHTACTAMEIGKSLMPAIHHTVALVRDSDGHDEFQAALAEGKGVILLAPHHSNWEIFGHFATHDVAAKFMYQPPKSAAMDRILKAGRSRGGVTMAPTSRKGVAQVLAALQRGELVGVLPDQVPAPGSGEFAPFFGQPAYTMTLVSKLAQRTGASVFCGFGQRLPGGAGFRAVFRRVPDGIYSTDMSTSLTAMNEAVEACVLMAPAQYQWEYKRFRLRPDGSEFY